MTKRYMHIHRPYTNFKGFVINYFEILFEDISYLFGSKQKWSLTILLHTVTTVAGSKPKGYRFYEAFTLVKQILGLLSTRYPVARSFLI